MTCLQALHPVLLDGQPVAGLRYDVTNDAKSDLPALLAMSDIRELPNGRHELHIARSAPAPSPKREVDRGFDRIVFWK